MSFYKVPMKAGRTPLKDYGLGIRMQPTVVTPEAVIETLPGLPNVKPPQLDGLVWVAPDGVVYPDPEVTHSPVFDGLTTDYFRTVMIGRIVGKFPNDMIWADTAYWGTHPQYGCSVLMEWIADPTGSSPGNAIGAMSTNGEWSLYGCPVEVYTTGPYFLLNIPLYDNFTNIWTGELRITVTCPGTDPLTISYFFIGTPI